MHKRTLISFAIVLVLAAGACSRRDDPPPPADEGRIQHERNSEFSGPRLQVFLTLAPTYRSTRPTMPSTRGPA